MTLTLCIFVKWGGGSPGDYQEGTKMSSLVNFSKNTSTPLQHIFRITVLY
jgi:hypothetical protein